MIQGFGAPARSKNVIFVSNNGNSSSTKYFHGGSSNTHCNDNSRLVAVLLNDMIISASAEILG